MGSIAGWQCGACGSGEEFYCGGGMFSFNEPAVVELAGDGRFGPAMKSLLGDGIPEGWTVYRESCFYECRDCGGTIDGGTIRIDDGSGGWLIYHDEPDVCGRCGYQLHMWDERVPLSEREIAARCDRRIEDGCPECGGKNILLQMGCWD